MNKIKLRSFKSSDHINEKDESYRGFWNLELNQCDVGWENASVLLLFLFAFVKPSLHNSILKKYHYVLYRLLINTVEKEANDQEMMQKKIPTPETRWEKLNR